MRFSLWLSPSLLWLRRVLLRLPLRAPRKSPFLSRKKTGGILTTKYPLLRLLRRRHHRHLQLNFQLSRKNRKRETLNHRGL